MDHNLSPANGDVPVVQSQKTGRLGRFWDHREAGATSRLIRRGHDHWVDGELLKASQSAIRIRVRHIRTVRKVQMETLKVRLVVREPKEETWSVEGLLS